MVPQLLARKDIYLRKRLSTIYNYFDFKMIKNEPRLLDRNTVRGKDEPKHFPQRFCCAD